MTGVHGGSTTPKKKKRGLMHSLYAAFFGSGHSHATKRPETPKTPTKSSHGGTFSKIVSSIRPLHAANGGVQSPPPPPPPPPSRPTLTPNSPSVASTLTGTKTSYTSADFADKAFELEEPENDAIREEEEVAISGTSAMMIGAFYQKIRAQALNSIGHAEEST